MNLKYTIIEILQEIEDEDKLQQILKFVHSVKDDKAINDLPEHTKASLADGIRNLQEGNVQDYTELERIVNKWLK